MDLSISWRRHQLPKNASQSDVTKEFLLCRGLRHVRADDVTWLLGVHSGEDPLGTDRLWRHRIFARFSNEEFGARFAELYAARYRSEGRRAANAWLSERHEAFARFRFDLALDETRIKRTAEEAARTARVMLAPPHAAVERVAVALGKRYQVTPPTCQPEGSRARLMCAQWWRRNLRRTHAMLFEGEARACGLVSSSRGRYASDPTVARRAEQRANTHRLLQLLLATNEIGDELPLDEIFRRSESNPPIRRAALNARLAGFEQIAVKAGYTAVFYTITCPSRMHARLDRGGVANARFDGTTPRKAQQYLCHQWQEARAKLFRLGIRPFGFRICEPHRDGTPHWHLLLFVRPDHREWLTEVLRHYALQDSPDEPGAARHRFRVEVIDPAKGSATGYAVKYISKHLDGRGLAVDEHGMAIAEAIRRVDAWASTWRIRQFQQIGGPPVGPWRELRRRPCAVDDEVVERCRAAADTGDWSAYFAAQGGPATRSRDVPVRVLRVWSDMPGRYGEPKGYVTRGVIAGNVAVLTRLHMWTISVREESVTARRALITGEPAGVRQSAAPGRPGFGGRPDAAQLPQPAGVPESRPAAALSPWSSVNNCTRRDKEPLPLPFPPVLQPPPVPTSTQWEPRHWHSKKHPRSEPVPDSVPPESAGPPAVE